MRHLTLEISPSSCADVLEALKVYKRDVKSALTEVCRRLAEIGAEEARLWASGGMATGNDDVTITTAAIRNGSKIVMSGEDIYFVEFGAGDFAGSYPGDTSMVSVDIRPGSWSETHTRQYYDNGFWYYGGVRYAGILPLMPLYHAGQKMRAEKPRIMREVFGRL